MKIDKKKIKYCVAFRLSDRNQLLLYITYRHKNSMFSLSDFEIFNIIQPLKNADSKKKNKMEFNQIYSMYFLNEYFNAFDFVKWNSLVDNELNT